MEEESKITESLVNISDLQVKKAERDDHGRLLPGNTANPNGRPKGSRNFTTDFDEVVEEIAKANGISVGEARKTLLKKAFTEARGGNFNFYKDILDRYYGKVVDKTEHSGKIEHEIESSPQVNEALNIATKAYDEVRLKQIKDNIQNEKI